MKRWQIILGILLIFFGLISLLDTLFVDIDFSRFVWPLILIGLGVLVIFRTQAVRKDVAFQVPVFGDKRSSGDWEVSNQEIWWFVGSNHLDFTDAIFPERDMTIRIIGFVNDLKIIIPEDVGLHLTANAFFSDYDGLDRKEERFLNMLEDQMNNYHAADKRIRIETIAFINDIKIQPSRI